MIYSRFKSVHIIAFFLLAGILFSSFGCSYTKWETPVEIGLAEDLKDIE